MDWTQAFLLLLAVLFMGSFGGGVLWNIRRGNAVLRWMQGGLPSIGEKTTLRWLGSSVVELKIQKAKTPFRSFTLMVVLQPRDVPWLWLISLARGRRDMVILRAQCAAAPRLEWDILAPQTWTGKSQLKEAQKERWEQHPLGELIFSAPRPSLPVSIDKAPSLLETARTVHPTVWRLSQRREGTHLELHMPLPDIKTDNPKRYFEAIRELGQKTGKD